MKTKNELLTAIAAGFADEAALSKFITDEGLTVDATALAGAADLAAKTDVVKAVVDAMPDAMPQTEFEAVVDAMPNPAPAFDFAAAMANFTAQAATIETPKQRVARVVRELMQKPGAIKVEGANVTKTVATQRDGYIQVSLSIDKPLPTFDASGNVIPIFAVTDTVISLLAVLTLGGYGDIVDYASRHNGVLPSLLSDAKIDIVTSFVAAGEVYRNPFSTSDRDLVARTNRINHYITAITFGERGLAEIEKIHDAQRAE